MYNIDELLNNATNIDGKWVISRPIPCRTIKQILKDTWAVFIGKAEAIRFYKQ